MTLSKTISVRKNSIVLLCTLLQSIIQINVRSLKILMAFFLNSKFYSIRDNVIRKLR